MPIFTYKAASPDGAITNGFIEAMDEAAALERIKSSGAILLNISAQAEKRKWFSRRPSSADLVTFTTELSALLGAGLPLDRSLSILSEISESGEMKAVVQSIVKSLREGSSFSDALQRHPRFFPRLYVNMIRAGESGGVVDVVLDKLNEFLESSKELKEHVVSAMIYPVILVITSGLSIAVLLTYVLPKFAVIFKEIGTSLPLSTQILLGVSNF